MINKWVEFPVWYKGRSRWTAARIAAITLNAYGAWQILLCYLDGTFKSHSDISAMRAIGPEELARYKRNYQRRQRYHSTRK